MAGIGAEAISPIRPDLATNLQPINFAVEQNAVAQLADAFRQGQVSSDDIIERYGTLAKTKEKAQIQGLEEFISPDAIQTRQKQRQATEVEAVLKSSPEYQAAQEAVFVDTRNKAEAGDHGAMRQAMLTKGWPLPEAFDPKKGWTPEVRKQTEQNFQEFINYESNIGAARAFLGTLKEAPVKESTTTIENGQQKTVIKERMRHVNALGVEVPEKDVAKISQYAAQTPSMWRHMGKPQFLELSGIKPGKFGGGLSGPLSEPEVQARNAGIGAGAPSAVRTVVEPDESTVTEVKIEPAKPDKAPTEAQQRAELALARFGQANEVFATMQKQGYDPTSVVSYVNSFLPEILKGGDRKTYEAAVDAWSQGLLRLESGAAISKQEKSWYERAFFPQVNDPPVVVENKAQMRRDIERMVGEIAQAGNVVSPESAAQIKRIYAQAGANVGAATSTQAGRPGMGKVTEVSPGKKLVLGADGQYRYVQ